MKGRGNYHPDWESIANALKEKHGWRCERCDVKHNRVTGHVLTVHHLDLQKDNNEEWNLAVLCQRCHLVVQGRVRMEQMVFDFRVSPWFRPHLEGYMAFLKRRSEEHRADKD